ncbi:DNA polymerase I [Hyphococcus flavus]|uniref:DNA polymerase I n=1 Tax=Hyphococcus flavus TaxID=1866326 RepID=A0AAE9ZLU3_9PROT|nr:DNA polymerase I [Hyphococcus flavus]WDI33120.1 DNA polymerase I [Hyphococcus flavus]
MAAKTKDAKRLYLVDGSAYIFRAYHALPPLTRKSDGAPVGAVSGFCNMLYKLLTDMADEHDPTHFAVIFDYSAKTFRNEIYSAYKANRPEPPEDLRPQFSMVRDATRAFNVPCIELEGYEADDLIATYARQVEAEGGEAVIISSDKDLMQLITDKVTMFDTMKNKKVGREEVIEKFGLGPEHVIDIQALAGDSTDNVPGVPGIGIKTAAQLIEEYGDLDTLLERAEEIKQKKRRENLIEFADQARISRDLVTLKTDTPVEDKIDDFVTRPIDKDMLVAFLKEMEFSTLTRRVEADLGGGESGLAAATSTSKEAVYETIFDEKTLQGWVDEARERGIVAFDTETDSLNAMRANLVGVSMATRAGRACYIPLGHGGDGLALDDEDAGKQIKIDKALKILKPLLEDASVLKIGQNLKYDALVLSRYDIRIAPFDDTMLMSYALDCGKGNHNMDELAERHLGHTTIKFSDIAGTGKKAKTFDQIAIKDASKYAAEDADITLRLYEVLKPRLAAEGKATVYETLERALAPIIVSMEREGVKVDKQVLSRLSSDFAQRMAAAEAEAHKIADEEFNLGSPKQISELLFGKLGLPGGKKTAKGAWSTKADVLEQLAADGHDLPQVILEWRGLSKLKSTYTDALPEEINPETGRVHTSYHMAATTTGRLSSNDPNLQNIPIRSEDGRKIRTAFIHEKGNTLVSADYSQIELRLVAHIADLKSMKQAFADGLDIHAMTASEMFDTPIKDMDPMVRRRAKAINFGIIYGISAFGLANQLGISRTEAKEYIDAYFKKFPGIRQYMDDTIASAKAQGFVETIFGRRTYVGGINDKNPAMRGYSERQAINAPIQGAAADVIRRAMIRMPSALKKAKLSAKMLMQVHDELIFECPEAEAEKTCDVIADVMIGAPAPVVNLSVPLVVDARAGANWEEAH